MNLNYTFILYDFSCSSLVLKIKQQCFVEENEYKALEDGFSDYKHYRYLYYNDIKAHSNW